MARIELKHLEAAIAVAEELSFSRAARRLHLSQPAITKYIAELEESLGVLLFVRDHHVVCLTEAGRAYVEEARTALLHAERAVQASRAVGRGADLVLNIGRSPYADPFFTSALLATRLPLFPKVNFNLSSGFSCDLVHAVLTGELDLAVAVHPPLSDLLAGIKIDESPLYVVIGRDDKLAGSPSLKLEHLAERRWMLFQRQSHPLLYDLIHKCAEESRIIPATLHHFMIPEEAIPLMNGPGSVVIVGKSGALRIARGGLTMRPLQEPDLITRTLLVSRIDNDSKVLSELIRSFMLRIKRMTNDNQLSLPLTA
jgi:DNA-binding transcriptional LysR family regulator